MERKFQIGVVGSFADKKLPKKLVSIAEGLGAEIGKRGHILMFGAELDGDSLSTRAAVAARREGGVSIAVVYGSQGEIFDQLSADVIIRTGSERGGPREAVFIMSTDGIIAISGGSGTMSEMLMAYQNRKPVVVIEGTGGWADKMANMFFDHRERAKAIGVKTPEEAVEKILELMSKGES